MSLSCATAEDSDRKLRRQAKQVPTVSKSASNHNGNGNNAIQTLFLDWCAVQAGVESLLEVQTFQYYDYVAAMKDRVDVFCEDCFDSQNYNDDDDDDELGGIFSNSDQTLSVTDYPTVPVRGLAASQNIVEGTLLIRIPHAALWTISNFIDDDPILSQVMGIDARIEHGWNSPMDEIPLLAVALLYHMTLGDASPQYPYIALLQDTPTSHFPHLWNSQQLRTWAPIGVRKVAKGIQKDVQEMYNSIVMPLIENHPDVFGSLADRNYLEGYYKDTEEEEYEEEIMSEEEGYGEIDDELAYEEWMFSLERFHWAFALVNSRHWYLKLPEHTSTPPTKSREMNEKLNNNNNNNSSSNKNNSLFSNETNKHKATVTTTATATASNDGSTESLHFSEQAAPPAAMPTDEWLALQREEHRKEEEESTISNDNSSDDTTDATEGYDSWPSGSSFLAPFADLLNFGPPCTRGIYNTTTHTFDIVATCNFRKGQEVTFWYADACQDVFVANYGFTHPMMVPPCVDNRHVRLQRDLMYALEDLDIIDSQLDRALQALKECNCDISKADATMKSLYDSNKTEPPSRRFQQGLALAPSPPTQPPAVPSQQARHAIRGANFNVDGAMTVRGSPKEVNVLERGGRKIRDDDRKSDL